jgi:hypothetical protein
MSFQLILRAQRCPDALEQMRLSGKLQIEVEWGIEVMRDKRILKILLAVLVLGAFYWFVLRADPKVVALNEALEQVASPALRNYPYTFRVVRLEGESALMGTPRSYEMPVFRMIGTLYPNLAGKAPNHPDFIAAEKELAQMQSEARQIVLDQPGVGSVKWELDQSWLISHNIQLN